MPKPDTFAEVVEWLNGKAAAILKLAMTAHDSHAVKMGEQAAQFAKAARLLAAAGEEVRAWRECPREHFSKVWDQPCMSGKHRSEYRQKINDARAALNALAPELENDHAG